MRLGTVGSSASNCQPSYHALKKMLGNARFSDTLHRWRPCKVRTNVQQVAGVVTMRESRQQHTAWNR
jgi:hypothetical protein